MKKKLIMLLAMLACMSASAQVKFGAKVGLDLTNFWGKECGHHMVLNYQAGLLMEYKFHPHFGISPEVVFAAQGGQEKADDGSEMGGFIRSDKHYHTNYINVPVMLKYYPTQDFSIDFGPQVGFNVYSTKTRPKPLISGWALGVPITLIRMSLFSCATPWDSLEYSNR